MQKLSVVIITLNEERNIARCLSSVNEIADDIVVVDSGSTDRTEEICKSYNVKFISKPWRGYSDQKNFANTLAQYDWIFSIDADEELSPELIQSIKEAKNKNQIAYYKINRLTNYCGKWIKHGGWYPDIKLRIFDRTKSQWEGTIHELLTNEMNIPSVLLKGNCNHYTYYNKEEHYAQARKFSSISAQDFFTKGKKTGFLRPVLSCVAKFISQFYFRFGFLDGMAGFRIAYISAKAAYWKYSELNKLNHGQK
jgi:glycosyltransferase involved in cell wall biosynthesis